MTERELFYNLLEIADSTQRKTYLETACKGDESLRRRMEALLHSHDSAGDFLVQPIAFPADAAKETNDFGHRSREGVLNHFRSAALLHDELLSHLSPSRRHDSLGRLGHYEILEVLGKGGNGVVFKAFDEKLHRFVAIKIMSDQLGSLERDRFLREARLAAAVRHENVVAVYAVEELPTPFLVMEYVPAKSLQELVDNTGPLRVNDAISVAGQIAGGLAAAHALGLIHRDIKPSNILLETGESPRVKIVDFGLARDMKDASLTQSGVIAGTPLYMSPEQALGEPLDHRTDLFSLGSVIYFSLTGRSPFSASTTLAVLHRVTEEDPRAITELSRSIPEWLAEIVAILIAKRPADRFKTALDVVHALQQKNVKLAPLAAIHIAENTSRNMVSRKFTIGVLCLFALVALGGVTYLLQLGSNPEDRSEKPVSRAKPDEAIAPFNSARAASLQEEWSDYLRVSKEITNSIGMKFLLIPPGEFKMGSSTKEVEELIALANNEHLPQWAIDNLRIEGPEHLVQISRPFYVAIFETTVHEFRRMVSDDKYIVDSIRSGEGGTYEGNKSSIDLDWESPFPKHKAQDGEPVRQVSWNDAEHFCNWLSTKENKRYRLLTEAEWEYACRAGTTSRFHTGDSLTSKQARISAGSPVKVGSFPANPWGLHDVLGNVAEWCFDQIDDNYGHSHRLDPRQSTDNVDQERVIRGGAFFERMPRVAQRRGQKKSYRADTIGFRIAMEIDELPNPNGK